MNIIDDLEEIDRRKKLADFYYDNYVKYYYEKKYSKASEFLWGVINNLLYAIGMFYIKKISDHGAAVKFIEELSAIYKDVNFSVYLASAQSIHANFFHDYMDRLMFDDDKDNVLKLIEILNNILEEKYKILIKKPTTS